MTTESKFKIKQLLQDFCAGFDSQAKAARALTDVSSATVSQVLNDNWGLIADRMWISIGKQVGFETGTWNNVKTKNYVKIKELLKDAKDKSRVHAITAGAGWGKDTAAKDFNIENDNVYLINCGDYFNRRYFMIELLRKMGKDTNGSLPILVERAVSEINRTETPIIIINEADKLNDATLYFFITIYNLCEGKCGIVLMATSNLIDRLTINNAPRNKKGYPEIFSRLGSKFICLPMPSRIDVTAICTGNGVTDPADINEIYNSSKGDLRRVKKLVQNKAKVADDIAA
jgi:plasmid maintenance system antidote protein VapI